MTTLNEACPICGEGCLIACIGSSQLEYKGEAAEVEAQYSVCDSCGCEQATESQLRTNKRASIAFKKKVDGLLTGAEVRVFREYFGITQADAAKIFGGGPVAFSKYESDDLAQAKARDNLLRVAYEEHRVFINLAAKAGVRVRDKYINNNAAISPDKLFTGKWISYGVNQPRSLALSVHLTTTPYSVNSEWKDLVFPENELKKSA